MSKYAPKFTYKFMGKGQAVASADRWWCALTMAAAQVIQGEKLLGSARGMTDEEIFQEISKAASDFGMNVNFMSWARALAGASQRPDCSLDILNGFSISPYQRIAIDRLSAAGGVLAVGCGLGKTLMACAAAIEYATEWGGGTRCYIICPLNAKPAWADWVQILNTIFKEVEVISVDSLHHLKALDQQEYSVIIFDEAHMLGSAKTKRTKEAHMVRSCFQVGLCLTGTLLHGGVEKCLSVQDLAIPGASGFSSSWNAGRQFNCLYKHDIGARTVTSLGAPTGQYFEEFKEYLSRYTIFLTPDSELVTRDISIPEQAVTNFDLRPCIKPVDDEVVDMALKMAEESEDKTIPHAASVYHRLSCEGAEEKLDVLMPVIGIDPFVIFTAYTKTMEATKARLEDEGISYAFIDGSVTGKNRAKVLEEWDHHKFQVLVAQIDAASVSMNLQRAHRSALIDVTWKAANYDQALARTRRRGQTRQCEHVNLYSNSFQRYVLTRIQQAKNFDSSVAEWQEMKDKIDTLQSGASL